MNVKKSVQSTIDSRGSLYGDYGTTIMYRNAIVQRASEIYEQHHGHPMPDVYKQYLWDVANKLCRIAITPNHVDSWHDIQGYAARIEEDLIKTQTGVQHASQ